MAVWASWIALVVASGLPGLAARPRARDSPGKVPSNGRHGAPELCGAAAWRASVHRHPILQKGLEMLRELGKLAADGAKLTSGLSLLAGPYSGDPLAPSRHCVDYVDSR
jgi:hypothetical protein